jgi:hypothetical protein
MRPVEELEHATEVVEAAFVTDLASFTIRVSSAGLVEPELAPPRKGDYGTSIRISAEKALEPTSFLARTRT